MSKWKKARRLVGIMAVWLVCFSSFPLGADAFSITSYDNMPVDGDIVLGPGKIELSMMPGATATRDMNITNRTGKILNISIDIEDFTGDNSNSTKLLGEEKGPYSLRDYIRPDRSVFQLAHGEKATLPVAVNIPADAEPGGMYGAAIVRAEDISSEVGEAVQGAQGQVSVVSRLAQLFFVRVEGETKEEGVLKSFTADKKVYQKMPVEFSIVYENKGKVHLNPYAKIEIKNILGKKIDVIEAAPWFVMPGFDRTKVVTWDKKVAFGRYTAHLQLNRGYGDIIDEETAVFWVIPTKVLLIGGLVVLFLALSIWWFSSKFELKKKK